ncbi:hypothetical protein D5086_004320 [Populus alba]|uniref:Uncharacterized protein n=1 Tax=Populus alba TaxID=43335 RepID=A0ACC4CR87_POPAL
MAKSHALFLLLLLLLVDACRPSHQQDQNRISSDDLAALAAVKDSLTDIPGSNFFSTWDFTSPDPCSAFSGITCSLNRVTILTLGNGVSSARGLAGFLSPSVSNLTELTQLVLYPGLVTGPIPPQLGLLSNLRVLSLSNNRLKGPIPSSLSLLPSLHTLDLSYNQLTGTVPPGLFTGLSQLKVMILASNQLSGELPRIVSAGILHLDLKDNSLTGTLPLRLPSTIRYLSASKNMMWGSLNGLQSLSEFRVSRLKHEPIQWAHTFLSLEAPLSSLFLQRNNLSGGVPTSLPSSIFNVRRGINRGLEPQSPDRVQGMPAASGGEQLSRPESQCVVFNHGRSIP